MRGWISAVTLAGLAAGLVGGLPAPAARAETNHVRVVRQFGILYLPLMVMEDSRILQKHAAAAGLGDVAVEFTRLSGGSATNDALLTGNVEFAATGTPELILLWSRTRGAMKGVGGLSAMPMYLNTRNPAIRTLKDFSEADRIAVPAVKVSGSALVLQMAAAQAYGPANYGKLDALTVSLGHPDAYAALASGISGVNSHFTISPFADLELARVPGTRTILTSYDVLGGPSTSGTIIATQKFHDANPKTYAAFVSALEESIAIANRDKRRAAEIYLRLSNDTQTSVDDLVKILENPKNEFSIVPHKLEAFADFMASTGIISRKPDSWKDMFFPNVHGMQGS